MIAKIFLIIKKFFCKITNYRKMLKEKKEKEKTDDIYPLF
tara:strand:+ start:185 stop:304 length:120 start_codon:yes stop_codon:yes gene_type:complete